MAYSETFGHLPARARSAFVARALRAAGDRVVEVETAEALLRGTVAKVYGRSGATVLEESGRRTYVEFGLVRSVTDVQARRDAIAADEAAVAARNAEFEAMLERTRAEIADTIAARDAGEAGTD